MSKNCVFSPSRPFLDIFRTIFRHFSDILSTFPFSGLSNDLPVTKLDFPDFSRICTIFRGFSRLVLFLFLSLLEAPRRKVPDRVRDTIRTFPEKSGKTLLVWKPPSLPSLDHHLTDTFRTLQNYSPGMVLTSNTMCFSQRTRRREKSKGQ